ncbi:MAG TPA: M23 family metallopeptidase [Patescibacteria group bacterium]|nr:M23 family metallopeptidase [Patescibacteria group bacterium]
MTPGQLVGLVGMTGLATGPHVHLEIDVGGKPVDPGLWLGSG